MNDVIKKLNKSESDYSKLLIISNEDKNEIIVKENKIKLFQTQLEKLKNDYTKDYEDMIIKSVSNNKLEKEKLELKYTNEMEKMELNYKLNLDNINRQIEETKEKTNIQLTTMEHEFKDIQLQHEKDLQKSELKFEDAIKQAEYIMFEQDSNNKLLNQTTEDLKLELNKNDNLYKKDLTQLEDKVEQLAMSAKDEQDKFGRFRIEKNNEIDNMARHYREITRELSLKTEVIDELTREKEDLRTSIKELQ